MNTHDIVYGDNGTDDTPESTPADSAAIVSSSIPTPDAGRLDSMLAVLPDRPMRKDSYKPKGSSGAIAWFKKLLAGIQS